MKEAIGILLITCSPFIVGGLILLVIRLQDIYQQYKYEHAVEVRNAKIEKLGLKPPKGIKLHIAEDHDYSADRSWFKDEPGVWK